MKKPEGKFELREEAIVSWTEFTPKEAAEHGLVCVEGSPVQGPFNSEGEECPWPWEPQQLGGAPMGQYHCPYCGGMEMAGVEHADWTWEDIVEMESKMRRVAEEGPSVAKGTPVDVSE